MPYGSIQKLQLILQACLFKIGSGSGIHFRTLPTIMHIYLVYIFHQFYGLFFTDILMERSAKIIGDIVFSVGKGSRPSKTTHDRTGFTTDTAFYLVSINWAMPLLQRMSCFKNRNLQIGSVFCQFVCRKNSAWSRTYNNNVILHHLLSPFRF